MLWSEDRKIWGNHERLVSANVVARHLSPTTGTHHAIDVKDLFNSMNVNCNITSSDITTPSQLLHTTRFNITLKDSIDTNLIDTTLRNATYVGSTTKFDSNQIFELGRRYGAYGRIFNHAIIVRNNLLVNNNTIKGWAFVPQEGNTILSTIDAFLNMTSNRAESTIKRLEADFLVKNW